MHTPKPSPGSRPYALTRSEFFEALRAAKGGHCVACGALDHLDFHHVDPATKVGEVTRMARHEALSEASKCILLCADCHRDVHSVQDWHLAVYGRFRRGQR